MDFTGILPVAPTAFKPDGTVDEEGMTRILDCMIDQGADAICILANFSEQFLMGDPEKRRLNDLCCAHVAGRVPVIVAVSHFATAVAVRKAINARDAGAAAVMLMPPYHGATLRAAPQQIFEHVAAVAGVGLPVVVQDAPLSGVEMPVELLARMARDIEMVKAFKIEGPGAAAKLRALVAAGGDAVEGPMDGDEGITLIADLDAGARGCMSSALIPDLIGPILRDHLAGNRDAALAAYARVLPLITHENRQCGFRAAKAAMVEGGVIGSDFCRHPVPPLAPEARALLFELLRPLDPLVLRWGK